MSYNMGVAEGHIDLDFSDLKTAAASAVRELDKLERAGNLSQSQMNKLEAAAKGTAGMFEQAKQKSASLSQQIDNAKQKVSVYKTAIDGLNDIIKRNASEQESLRGKISAANTALDNAEQKVKELGTAHRTAAKEAESAAEAVKAAAKQYGEESDEVKKAAAAHEDAVKVQMEAKEAYDKAAESAQKHRDELLQLESREASLGRETENSKAKINDFAAKINNTEADIANMSRELQTAENKLAMFGAAAQTAGEKWKAAGDKISKAGSALTIGVSVPLATAGVSVFKAASDFETAFTGVEKTVDATNQQLAALKQGIIDMSQEIPASTTTIAAVAEAAGQLGIQTDNILSFTRVMVDLGNATNLSAEDAASALAKFANVTGMSQTDFDRLGAVIVALGNNFATTEADIVAMGTRLAGAGSQVGMTEPQIMGLATALSSVGIEAEMGGSAFSTLMSKMQLSVEQGGEGLKAFAEVAGMSAEQFQTAFKEDAASAIVAFIQGLSNCEDKGKSAIGVLDDMGITEIRQRDALLRAAGASDVFTEAIQMGSQAWEENTALTNEASKRYATTESQLQIAKNAITEAARALGQLLIPEVTDIAKQVKNAADKFAKLDDKTKKNIISIAKFAIAIGPVTTGIGKLTKGVGDVISTSGKLIKTVSGVMVATKGLTGATKAAAVAQGLLNAAWKANPAGVVITSIALLAAGLYALHKAIEEANKEEIEFAKSQEHLSETLADGVEAAAEWKDGIDSAKGILDGCNESIMASSEKQAELSSRMEEIQNEITSIARTATEERRSLTQQEIDRLNELFEQMKQVADQQLELEMSKQQAVKDVIQSTVDTWDGTAAEYETKAQDMIKSAQDTRDGVISALESQLINETMLINQRTDLSAEAKEQMIRDATEAKNQKVQLANDEYAETYAIITNGQAQVLSSNDSFYTSYVSALNKMAESERNYNTDMLEWKNYYIDQVKLGEMTQIEAVEAYQAKTQSLSRQHNEDMRSIWADYSNGLTDEQAKDAAILVQMAADTEASGKQIDESTRSMIGAILSSYSMLDEEGQKKLSDAFAAMDMEITDGGELVYSSGENAGKKVIEGFNSADIPEYFEQIAGDSAEAYKNASDNRTETYYQSGVDDITATVEGIDSVDTASPAAKKIDEAVKAMDDTFSDADLKFLSQQYGDLVPTGFAAGIGGATALVVSKTDSISDTVNQLSSFPSYTWGSHLASGFASGINDNVQLISDAAWVAAEAARAALHFTRPDEGPLRNYEQWPVHFISRYAELIKQQKSKVQQAALAVANCVADVLSMSAVGKDFDLNQYAFSDFSGTMTIRAESDLIDYARLAKAIAKELQDSPITVENKIENHITTEMDGEIVGRKVAPVVSKVIAKNSKLHK